MNPIILILLLIWEIYWKAHALWIAARKGDKNFYKLPEPKWRSN